MQVRVKGMHAGTAIESFRTLLRGKIMKRFTLVRDPTCAQSVERAIAGMQTFGGTRKGVKAKKGVLRWGRLKAKGWKRRWSLYSVMWQEIMREIIWRKRR